MPQVPRRVPWYKFKYSPVELAFVLFAFAAAIVLFKVYVPDR